MTESTKVECFNCGWTGDAEETDDIKDFWSRVEPGETIPHGDCPNCGAFCYAEEPKAARGGVMSRDNIEREKLREMVDILYAAATTAGDAMNAVSGALPEDHEAQHCLSTTLHLLAASLLRAELLGVQMISRMSNEQE